MDTVKELKTNGANADPKTLARELAATLEAKEAALVYGLEPGSRAAHALQVAEAVAQQRMTWRKTTGQNSSDLPDANVIFRATLGLD